MKNIFFEFVFEKRERVKILVKVYKAQSKLNKFGISDEIEAVSTLHYCVYPHVEFLEIGTDFFKLFPCIRVFVQVFRSYPLEKYLGWVFLCIWRVREKEKLVHFGIRLSADIFAIELNLIVWGPTS
jgi:hypothetical protein